MLFMDNLQVKLTDAVMYPSRWLFCIL